MNSRIALFPCVLALSSACVRGPLDVEDNLAGQDASATDPKNWNRTMCLENGAWRRVASPAPGDLAVVEVMANPAAVSDALGEWFEIVALAPFDLNAVYIAREADNLLPLLDGDACAPVTTGELVVVARSTESQNNGGLPPPTAMFSFGLANSGGSLTISSADAVLDHVAWETAPNGASLVVDPRLQSPEGNDEASSWCEEQAPYNPQDRGTPGLPNTPCQTSDTCFEGNEKRSIVAPRRGDVHISEIMADPTAVPDSAGEWLEVYFAAAADLNGLQLGRAATPELDVEVSVMARECISIGADSYVVFARNTDPSTNGGVVAADQISADISLSQRAGTTYPLFVAWAGEVLASTQYSGTEVQPGSSLMLAVDGARCSATTLYNQQDRGSPGAPNESCAPPSPAP